MAQINSSTKNNAFLDGCCWRIQVKNVPAISGHKTEADSKASKVKVHLMEWLKHTTASKTIYSHPLFYPLFLPASWHLSAASIAALAIHPSTRSAPSSYNSANTYNCNDSQFELLCGHLHIQICVTSPWDIQCNLQWNCEVKLQSFPSSSRKSNRQEFILPNVRVLSCPRTPCVTAQAEGNIFNEM